MPTLFDLCELAVNEMGTARYVVNLGCHDGVSYSDPCHALYQAGYKGLAIDLDVYPELYKNLPADVIKVMGFKLSPDTCWPLVNACPDTYAGLKIDLDGYDADVLIEWLNHDSVPLVIQAEVNPDIPPPVAFAVHYDDAYVGGGHFGFYGCSVQYLVNHLPLYDLVALDFTTGMTHDAIFAHKAMALTPIDPLQAWLQSPPGHSHLREVGIDTSRWRDPSLPEQIVDEVHDAMVIASKAKHAGRVLPFTCRYGARAVGAV